MIAESVAGLAAGVAVGVVLQRGQLCFHSAIAGTYHSHFLLARGWALGVALGSVGLAVLFVLPGTDGLNRGLAFTPVANVVGGLTIGVGMAVALSCTSGLFYKLGEGMLGAVVGLAGWATGELVARQLPDLPGPTLLPSGDGGTLPGVLGLPRLVVAAAVLAAVALWLWQRPGDDRPQHRWQWGWRTLGVGLGAALTAGWVLAAVGGVSFGPSSVGAVSSIASGSPKYWLIAFLVGITAGGLLAARTAGGWWVRGEQPVRYLQLAIGGALLGAGGWIAGGCNLGHGLSGVAQLNISSAVVVASMVAGVGATRAAQRTMSAQRATQPS
ncbi:MAG: YeeE/YedE family protein [Nocardioidaceae bacterium]|nr:YeeE/YedE family protein [Nocardioidaceae bacterium]MDQ3324522.1 YeeE/YedE family protein [Actinomycetota bacterium]